MKSCCLALIICIKICISNFAQQPDDAAYQLYLTQIAASEALLQLNKISEARDYLDACDEKYRDIEWHFLNTHLDQSARTITKPNDAYFTAIAMCPDGNTLAACGSDSTIALYAYPAMQLIRELTGHQSSVSTIVFSNDGTILASGGRDHTVIFWDVRTGTELRRNATAFKQGIYQVRFRPDDSKLGVVSWERTASGVKGFAKLLNAKDAVEILKAETDSHPAAGIVFTPDGMLMIVATWGENVYAFDINSGETTWKYDLSGYDEYNAFHSIALSPDGTTVAVGSVDHRIHFLHASDGRLIRRIEPWEGHTKTIKALSFSQDGKWLASAGEDQTILVWNVHENTKHASLIGHTQTATGLCWSADGSTLFSTSADGTLKQWDLDHPFARSYIICDVGPWQSPVTTDKKYFAAPCTDKNLAMYEISTGKVLKNFGPQSGLCAEVSKDGNYLVTGSFDGIARLWNVQTGKEIGTYAGHTGRIDGIAYMTSKGFAISVGDNTMRIWSGADSLLNMIQLLHSAFRVVLHPKETFVYTGSYDGSITEYNTTNWTETQKFTCSKGLQEMTINADGNLLAAFSGKDIKVWNVKTGIREHLLSGHEQSGYGIDFSPDGRYLISGSDDQTFRLWNLEKGMCVMRYHGYEDVIYSCKFLSDNEFLVGTSQGQMWYYHFHPTQRE